MIKRKLLIVSGSLPPVHCGVGLYTAALLEKLRMTEDFSLSILANSGSQPIEGVTILHNDDWGVTSLRKILRQIKSQEPNIIHIEYPEVKYKRQIGINLLALKIRTTLKLKRVKIIVTIHELHELRLLALIRTYITMLGAHRIVVTNAWDYDLLPTLFRKKASIIPIAPTLAVSPRDDDKTAELQHKYKINKDIPVLSFFGMIAPNKGIENLIDAAIILKDYQVVLLSEFNDNDDYHLSVRRYIDTKGVSGRVLWLGYLDDASASLLLSTSRYCILPSVPPISTKSGTLLAALTHELVIITTGGHEKETYAEPLKNMENCILLPEPSGQNISGTVLLLDNQPTTYKALSEGSKSIANQYTWESVSSKHALLYKELFS